MFLSGAAPQTRASETTLAQARVGLWSVRVHPEPSLGQCPTAVVLRRDWPVLQKAPTMKDSLLTNRIVNRTWILAVCGLLALTLPAAGATYVGSLTCAGCHPTKYTQVANSIHS